MNNPHNPEFITKRPWYLGDGDAGSAAAAAVDAASLDAASLQHQASHQERRELSLTAAEELLAQQRRKLASTLKNDQWESGQWVEALKKNKGPYRMCQIMKIHKEASSSSSLSFDLKFEDGSVEKKVKLTSGSSSTGSKPRIKRTGAGSRTATATTSTTTTAASSAVQYQETFASKRDQYHGYDRDKHNAIVGQRYDEKLAIRRELRQKRQQEKSEATTTPASADPNAAKSKSGSDSDWNDSDVEGSDHDDDDDSDPDGDEFVQRDADDRVMTTRLARQGGVGGAQMKVTARNLRIREDTAKYLRNLNVDSAYYDPKSRSMRDNPNPEYSGPGGETDFAGDNFARISGDAVALAQQQHFAWENSVPDTSGGDGTSSDPAPSSVAIHPQANPSQAELLHKKYQNKAQEAKQEAQRAVLAKYGGAEYLDGRDGLASAASEVAKQSSGTSNAASPPPSATNRALRFGASTSAEHQYNRDGTLLASGNEKSKRAAAKMSALTSKYEENIFRHGHSTVWGSFFHKGAWMWGYADDHSLLKLSYCTGDTGRLANDEANALAYGTGQAGSAELAQARALLPSLVTTGASSRAVPHQRRSNHDDIGKPIDALDETKGKHILVQQRNAGTDVGDVKKRKYQSMEAEEDVTPEMLQVYRVQKDKSIDPMANMENTELLDYKSAERS